MTATLATRLVEQSKLDWSTTVAEPFPESAPTVFRTTNPDYTGPDAAAGHYVGLDTAGFVILGMMNNAWVALTNTPVTVNLNSWYHLKVTLKGSEIGVYVGNMSTPKFTRVDTNFTRGQIGVRSFQCDAQFDNVTFSNAVPLTLKLSRSTGQLNLLWPETSVSVDLMAGEPWSSSSPAAGSPILTNGTWRQSVPLPSVPVQYHWLQAH